MVKIITMGYLFRATTFRPIKERCSVLSSIAKPFSIFSVFANLGGVGCFMSTVPSQRQKNLIFFLTMAVKFVKISRISKTTDFIFEANFCQRMSGQFFNFFGCSLKIFFFSQLLHQFPFRIKVDRDNGFVCY